MVSAVVAEGVQQRKYKFFITEREQEKENRGKRRRFDAICYEPENSELVAIEVEASSKMIPHRKEILQRYQREIEEGRIHRVLLLSHKRRFLVDAERIHRKLFSKSDNQLDEEFFNNHVKYVFSKVMIAMLYQKFWMH